MAHISNTEHSQIVALIFDTDEHTREALSHNLAPAIATELSTTVTPLTTDWISTIPTKTLRITLSTSSPTPITLQHCTHLAHSPSIAAWKPPSPPKSLSSPQPTCISTPARA